MPLPEFKRNFGGAISLATWIKANNFGISTAIRSNISPAFVECVSKFIGKPIQFYFIPELRSISVSLTDSECCKILIPDSFNKCHRRFALTKELCHALTDDASVSAESPSEQLEIARLGSDLVRRKQMTLFAKDLNSEDFCFLLALEIIIPLSHRQPILDRLKRGESSYDIAFELQIPESLIIFYRDSLYHQFYILNLRANSPGG